MGWGPADEIELESRAFWQEEGDLQQGKDVESQWSLQKKMMMMMMTRRKMMKMMKMMMMKKLNCLKHFEILLP